DSKKKRDSVVGHNITKMNRKMSRVTFQESPKDERAPKQTSSAVGTGVKSTPQFQVGNGSATRTGSTEAAFTLKGLLAAKRLTKELK
ncbi:hypothetical protein NDU88_002189, partial [Pleurodeles waltl]